MTWEHIKILTALISVLLTGCKEIKGYLETQKPDNTPPPIIIELPTTGDLVPATVYWTAVTTYEDGTVIEGEVFYNLYLNNNLFVVTTDLQLYSEWKKGDCFYTTVSTSKSPESDKSNEICL